MNHFEDRIVLVTGAGSGIGRATAQAFAARGARIIATDLSEAALSETQALITAVGGRCETRIADVADEASMQALADDMHPAMTLRGRAGAQRRHRSGRPLFSTRLGQS